MSKESVYTTPRDVHGYFESTTLTALSPRSNNNNNNNNNNTQDRYWQDDQPPLGIKVTRYDLLYLVVILAFGIWKAISSYRGQSVAWTTRDWVVGTFLVFISYCAGVFKDNRLESINFLSSLLSLWASVSQLRLLSFLDGMWDAKYSSSFIGNPYAAVYMAFVIAILATLRQFTKFVCPRLVGFYPLAWDILKMGYVTLWTSLLVYFGLYVYAYRDLPTGRSLLGQPLSNVFFLVGLSLLGNLMLIVQPDSWLKVRPRRRS
ncbi:hypothetical protein BJV74DRAFT_494636 [Russula compacta]|nr:hypothetical protein BJV74DRAFT_494636 [Russula compacta]